MHLRNPWLCGNTVPSASILDANGYDTLHTKLHVPPNLKLSALGALISQGTGSERAGQEAASTVRLRRFANWADLGRPAEACFKIRACFRCLVSLHAVSVLYAKCIYACKHTPQHTHTHLAYEMLACV